MKRMVFENQYPIDILGLEEQNWGIQRKTIAMQLP